MENTSNPPPRTLNRYAHDTLQAYGAAGILALLVIVFVPAWVRWCGLYLVGITFLSSVIYPFVEDWKPRSRVNSSGKAVFITGCDSGFGYKLAGRLDDLGLTVFAGCLFPEGEGAKALKKVSSNKLQIVPLDVTSDESIDKAYKFVFQKLNNNKLWAVVNNAGVNLGGQLIWTSVDTIKRIMDINTYGVVKVTKAFLPLLCQFKGRVVAVASAAGRFTYPSLVPYCMSKQAVVSFCDGLRVEMCHHGIKVVTIEPYMYKTSITNENSINQYVTKEWTLAPTEVQSLFSPDFLSRYLKNVHKFLNYSISDKPEQVVDCLEEAVMAMQPKYSYSPGTIYSRFIIWIFQRIPRPIADLLHYNEFSLLP